MEKLTAQLLAHVERMADLNSKDKRRKSEANPLGGGTFQEGRVFPS